jgi:hypothetical protein
VILAQGGPPHPPPKKDCGVFGILCNGLVHLCKKKKKKKKIFNIKFKVQQLARHFAIEYLFFLNILKNRPP